MLPKNLVKTTSILLIFFLTVQGSILPMNNYKTIKKTYKSFIINPITLFSIIYDIQKAHAGAFEDAVQSGKSSAKQLTPKTDSTFMQKGKSATPFITEAEQSGDYNNYYSDPTGLQVAPNNNEPANFIKNSYETRQKFNLKEDPIFGYTCLEKDPVTGKCTKQSLSDQILKAYPDCNEVIEPIYDAPPIFKTCEGTSNIVTTPLCDIKSLIEITTENVSTPCSMTNPDFRPNQLYAACKDHYDWYQVGKESGSEHCNTPSSAFVVSSPPDGAEWKFKCRGRDYYAKYRHSTIERVIKQISSPNCGANVHEWLEECVVKKMDLCNLSESRCVTAIENGEETGLLPSEPPLYIKDTPVIESIYACTAPPACEEIEDEVVYSGNLETIYYNCSNTTGCLSPTGGKGLCPKNAVLQAPASDSTLIGINRTISDAYCAETYDFSSGNPELVSADTRSYTTQNFYKNPSFFCHAFAGSLRDYNICMRYFTVDLDAGDGPVQLSTSPVRTDGSCREVLYRRGKTLYENYVTITWFEIYGAPDIKDHLNIWLSKIEFLCDENTDNCQQLIEQGCTHYSQRCTNPPDCTRWEFTYKCGGTGNIIGYNKSVVCAGNVRCMGSDCTDTSYVANADFEAAVAAAEIINMARTDTMNMVIFPGKKYACQSSPIDCCKPTTGEISIKDYIKAGHEMYKIYSVASQGFSAASSAFAKQITTIGNKIISNFTDITASYLVDGAGVTWTTLSSPLGNTTVTTSFSGSTGAATTQVAGSTASATIQAIGTIMTAIGVIMSIYAIATLLYNIMFGCKEDDLETSVKLGFKLCHYIGKRCTSEVLGKCVAKEKVYCCFNSILARIIHQQGRPQIGIPWGSPERPNCRGFTPGELGSIDFSQIDLSEYMQYVEARTELNEGQEEDIRIRAEERAREILEQNR